MYCRHARVQQVITPHTRRRRRSIAQAFSRASLFLGWLSTIAAGLSLQGCEKYFEYPEINECEDWVQLDLLAPSTYQRIKVDISDSPPLSRAEFQRRARSPKLPSQDGLRIRTVVLNYDAANTYGTPLRQTMTCNFKVTPEDRKRRSAFEFDDATVKGLVEHESDEANKQGECCIDMADKAKVLAAELLPASDQAKAEAR